ncbi:MAG: hypothetical protein WD556_03285 [Actinomycetota bacterium]
MTEQIIAKQGPADRYMVLIGGNPNDATGMCRILDLNVGYHEEPVRVQSILRQGWWEPYEPVPGELDALKKFMGPVTVTGVVPPSGTTTAHED